MWRFGIVLICTVSVIWADDLIDHPPLFASVTGVMENDRLNVRSKPDFHSQKTASLPDKAYVGVDECRQKGRSLWCRVHHIAQHDYEGYGWDAPDGWVNAQYLSFSNRGYVLINGKANCNYVIGCEQGVCDLVSDYMLNKHHEIISIKTKKIPRKYLRGESNFGAMDPGGDGYCMVGNKILDYLRIRSIQKLAAFSNDPAYQKALSFIQQYNLIEAENMIPFIHPQKGMRVGFHTHFSVYDRVIFPKEIRYMGKQRDKTYLWGYTVNEEKVVLSLYDLLLGMELDLYTLKEVQELSELRAFPCQEGTEYRGYVFYSYEKPRDIDFSWQGMVVIMQKIDDRWYVAGVLHDRWMI